MVKPTEIYLDASQSPNGTYSSLDKVIAYLNEVKLEEDALTNYATTTYVDEAISAIDLTNYYTKEEIDNLLANMPAGDIPSGEEVEW